MFMIDYVWGNKFLFNWVVISFMFVFNVDGVVWRSDKLFIIKKSYYLILRFLWFFVIIDL